MTRITAELADKLARKAKAYGVTTQNAGDELADVIDIETGSELDDVEMGIAYDMVLARLHKATPCRETLAAIDYDGGPSRDELGCVA